MLSQCFAWFTVYAAWVNACRSTRFSGGMPTRFVFGRHPVHPTMRASLFDPATGQSLADLECAQIKEVKENGFLVAGFELHPGSARTRQAWWCVPTCAGQNGMAGSSSIAPDQCQSSP